MPVGPADRTGPQDLVITELIATRNHRPRSDEFFVTATRPRPSRVSQTPHTSFLNDTASPDSPPDATSRPISAPLLRTPKGSSGRSRVDLTRFS